jgi:hypothetical protein
MEVSFGKGAHQKGWMATGRMARKCAMAIQIISVLTFDSTAFGLSSLRKGLNQAVTRRLE